MGNDGTDSFVERYTWVLDNRSFSAGQNPVTLPQADFNTFPIWLSSSSTNATTW